MIEFLVSLLIILIGLVCMCIYIVGIALRNASRQIVRMNERLLVLLGTRDGNEVVGRALVASSRKPVKPLKGVSQPKKKVPTNNNTDIVMTMGVK